MWLDFLMGGGRALIKGSLGRGVLLSPWNPDPALNPIVHFDTLIHFILHKKLRGFFKIYIMELDFLENTLLVPLMYRRSIPNFHTLYYYWNTYTNRTNKFPTQKHINIGQIKIKKIGCQVKYSNQNQHRKEVEGGGGGGGAVGRREVKNCASANCWCSFYIG